MDLNFLGKPNVVGLDIGSKNVKVVYFKSTGKNRYKLEKWALLPLPDNVVSPDVLPETRDPVVIQTLKTFYSKNKSIPKDVAISVSGSSIVVRYIKLPIMTKEELAKSIHIEAEPFIPFPIAEVNLAFDIVGEVMDEGVKKNEVVIVAVKKEFIDAKINLLKEINLTPRYIDVDVFALETVARHNYDLSKEVVCLVNIGANITNVSIIEEGATRVSRDLPLGVESILQNIKNIQQVDDTNILYEQMKTDGVIIKEEDKERYLQEEKRDALLFSKNLISVLKEFTVELHKIFDFYFFQKGEQKSLSRIFLSGGGTIIKNLDTFFAEELKLPTEIFDPFRRIEDGKKVPQELRPLFAVSAGLALKKWV